MRSNTNTGVNEPYVSVHRLNTDDFAMLQEQWRDLLENSDADPLFMSWPWLFSWWEVWGKALGLELALFGAYDASSRLVGLAPFYLHDYSSPFGLRVRRAHYLGNAWHISPTVRTEYSSLIIRKGLEETVTDALMIEVSRLNWHEMVVCDQLLPELSRWKKGLLLGGRKIALVTRSTDVGVRVPTEGLFQEWLSKLGANTRLKLYNRRLYIKQKRGDLALKHVTDQEVAGFFEHLNEFHRHRWGKNCFDEKAVAFHKKFIARLENQQLALTTLIFDGKTVSVLYDILAGSSRYNLQAGFREDFDRKVALGTLHLGYAIEECFGTERIRYYDLLAGYGKNSFYKSRFQGETVQFYTVQFARNPLMRGIYRAQTFLPEGLRRSLNRLARL
ncbi:GNAT family N-acetyltransferase [Marinobacter sp. F3R08]|uniref:GNAT family N-acetyltransferase n=1 Tax=Marinobacter sp. F3R08 TaxID=2841559 RepID=UPI001C0994A2|nr:GNAT family N-acetyltransferase [Marinobacter sp. F3R08]MBU2955618.1 GNAT family N-acetyltransferase [Marinobacter sp. F3R08]